jgi:hypothetical protein
VVDEFWNGATGTGWLAAPISYGCYENRNLSNMSKIFQANHVGKIISNLLQTNKTTLYRKWDVTSQIKKKGIIYDSPA